MLYPLRMSLLLRTFAINKGQSITSIENMKSDIIYTTYNDLSLNRNILCRHFE